MSMSKEHPNAEPSLQFDTALEEHQYCYLTTPGRKTGRPHRIEIWFAIVDGTLFVNSGGGRRSDWVKNLAVNPSVHVEIGVDHWAGIATMLDDANRDHSARQRLAERYVGWSSGEPLSDWPGGGLLVEIRIASGG